MRLAILGRELPPGAQVGAAVLELVAFSGQVLYAVIERHHGGDLLPDRGRVFEYKGAGGLRSHPVGQLEEHLPLRPRLRDSRPRDLGAEDHPALGRGLGDATRDLVARGRRQEQHVTVAVDQHLGAGDDVHVHPQRHAAQRRLDVGRVRQDLEPVAAGREEDVELARAGGVDHLRCRQPGLGGDLEAPLPAEVGGGLRRDRPAAGQGRWRRRPSRRRPARRSAPGSASARTCRGRRSRGSGRG